MKAVQRFLLWWGSAIQYINASRKKGIASGSGTNVSDVNAILKKFSDMQKMFKQMGKLDLSKMQKMLGM